MKERNRKKERKGEKVRETICDAFKAHQLSKDSVLSETSLLHLLQILKKSVFPIFFVERKSFYFEKRIFFAKSIKSGSATNPISQDGRLPS